MPVACRYSLVKRCLITPVRIHIIVIFTIIKVVLGVIIIIFVLIVAQIFFV